MGKSEWSSVFLLAKEYYKRYGNLNIPYNYSIKIGDNVINLGIWIRNQRQFYKTGRLSKDRIEMLESIGMTWSLQSLTWEQNFKLAEMYYKQYGNLNIPQSYTIKIGNDIIKLGTWLHSQRQLYKNGKLSKERINLLESIGMKWSDRFTLKWQVYFDLAKDYYNKNGNLKVPRLFTTKLDGSDDIINLGMWLQNQRDFYKNGKLSDERIKMLESIGMIWNVSLYDWEGYYKLACSYYEKYRNLDISNEYTVIVDNKKVNLGSWLYYQRQLYNNGKLSPKKIEMLENIGIEWLTPFIWEEKFKKAKVYYEHYGNLDVPRNFTTKNGYDYDASSDSIKLGKWINTQRTEYKNRRLSQERINLLESIGMKWSVYNVFGWDKKFEIAKAYYEHYGNLDVSFKFSTKNGYDYDGSSDSIKLGKWINTQRTEYKNGRLSQERINLLESIGMKWTLRKRKPMDEREIFCEKYGLDYQKYSDLLKIPYVVLLSKINYLNSNHIPLVDGDKINEIFFMSDVNMQVVYGISLEDLVKEYYNVYKKGVK